MSNTTLRIGLIIAIANGIMMSFIVNNIYSHPSAYVTAAFVTTLLCYFAIPRVKLAITEDRHRTFNTILLGAITYLPALISIILMRELISLHQIALPLAAGSVFFYIILQDHAPNDES